MDIDKFKYNLGPESIVFDVGGYEGEFTEFLSKKYHCGVHIFEPVNSFFQKILLKFEKDPLVWPYGVALENEDREGKIYIRDNSSSIHLGGPEHTQETIRIRDIMKFITAFKLPRIDLLKLNCEGSEYAIIPHLDHHDWLKNIGQIVVQFHQVEGQDKLNMERILAKTHTPKHQDDHWQHWKLL